MPLVDERGRLFGRVNLIDAGVGLLLLVLLPLAYGAYLLFRTPVPKVLAVEPAVVNRAPEMRVKIRGEDLRPFLRAVLGSEPARGFLFENANSADLMLPPLAPGTYDLALYDGGQELVRVPGAVTIVGPSPPPATRVQVVGTFIGLDEASARELSVGRRFPDKGDRPQAEILALGSLRPDVRWIRATDVNVAIPVEGRVQIPAVVRVSCEVAEQQCKVGELSLGPREVLPLPGAKGALNLLIEEVRSDTAPTVAELLVRFVAHPELADLVKVGDVDQLSSADQGRAASIVALKDKQVLSGQTSIRMPVSPTGATTDSTAPDRFAALQAVLQVGLEETPAGWHYKGQIVKVGATFTFTTPRYVMRGSILRISPAPSREGSSASR